MSPIGLSIDRAKALEARIQELEAERVSWPVKIFQHKYLDPYCVESGCQSIRVAELEATKRRYRAMVENGWQVVKLLDTMFAINDRKGVRIKEQLVSPPQDDGGFVITRKTPEAATDAAIERLESKT